jgi:hypothetical protein
MARIRRKYGTVLILTAVCAPALCAGSKTEVTVSFRLTEPDYRQEYTTDEIAALEAHLSTQVALRFNEHIGFLNFVSDPGPAYSLILELGRRNPQDPGPCWEVGFLVKVAGPQVRPPLDPYWLMFRHQDRYGDSRGSASDLEKALILKLTLLEDLDYEKLVSTFLGQVPLCNEGTKLWTDPLGWIVPYKLEEVWIDVGSQFLVENCFPSSLGPIAYNYPATMEKFIQESENTTYAGFILCLAPANAPELDRFQNVSADSILVRRVYVVEYHRYDACGAGPQSPTTVFATGGPQP